MVYRNRFAKEVRSWSYYDRVKVELKVVISNTTIVVFVKGKC
jgi:hypothetical protein